MVNGRDGGRVVCERNTRSSHIAHYGRIKYLGFGPTTKRATATTSNTRRCGWCVSKTRRRFVCAND